MKGGNATESENELVKQFDTSVNLVKSLPQSSSLSPSYAEAAKIYSYFKQAKFGPCSIPRPGFWDYVNRAKWDAWSALGDMSVEEAMRKYVDEIKNVYHRIKNIEEFEETHLNFADELILFCQITGADLTPQLIDIVKDRQSKLVASVMVNGSPYKESSNNDTKHVISNGNVDASHSSDDSDDDDHLSENEVNHHGINGQEAIKTTKSVKFDVNGNQPVVNGNIDILNNSVSESEENSKCNGMKLDNSIGSSQSYTPIEKEDGELTTSEGDDSDEGEIYCDSLSPDQLSKDNDGQCSAELEIAESVPVSPPVVTVQEQVVAVVDEVEVGAITEPQLFSLVSSTPFQGGRTSRTNSRKSDENSCSSNEYEVVDMERENFDNDQFNDRIPNAEVSCNGDRTLATKKRPNSKVCRIGSCKLPEKPLANSRNHCVCVAKGHKKVSSPHQSHSGGGAGNSNGKSANGGSNKSHNNQNNVSRSHPSRSHGSGNGSAMYQRSYDGSSNGNSDDSCSSLSSSSSDNVGLKIVKALERMDDNMHHILDRLDSIDNSMKKLAEQPPQPWWFRYLPSRSVVLSTIWPFVVQLLVYYFWRRRRRRLLRMPNKKAEATLIAANFQS